MTPMNPGSPVPNLPGTDSTQAGAGLLGVVAMLGVAFVLVQGTLHYRAKASARFQASEKNKVLAQQVAEAGVEENIADLGSRRLKPTSSTVQQVTYRGQPVGGGAFTSILTMVSAGADADTLDLVSTGRVASVSQDVQARIRLRRYVDTTRTVNMYVTPETTVTRFTVTRPETTVTMVVRDPATMPALDATPAYQACMASSARRCDVCHIPQGNPDNRHVIGVSKNAIHTHIDHHGDYVTTDGTCDLYNPAPVRAITDVTGLDSTVTVRDRTIYDTVVVIDTMAKVQILSWR